jgi:hypothetical protein
MQKREKSVLGTKAGESVFLYLLTARSRGEKSTCYSLMCNTGMTYRTVYFVLKRLQKEGIITRKSVYEKGLRKKVIDLNFQGIVSLLNDSLPEDSKLVKEEMEQLAKVLSEINWVIMFQPYSEKPDLISMLEDQFPQCKTLEQFLTFFQSISVLADRLPKVQKDTLTKIFNPLYLKELWKFFSLNKIILQKLKKLSSTSLERDFAEAEEIFEKVSKRDSYRRYTAFSGQVLTDINPSILFGKGIDKAFNTSQEG